MGLKTNLSRSELYDLVKTNREVFEFIHDEGTDGVWYSDLKNLGKEFVSDRLLKTLGVGLDSAEDNTEILRQMVFEEDLQHSRRVIEEKLQNPEKPFVIDVRYKHKQGHTVWIQCRGLVLKNSNGEATGILGIHRDISKLKLAEQTIHLNKQKFEAIFDQAAVGIGQIAVTTHQIIQINKKGIEILKIPDVDERKKSFRDLLPSNAFSQLSDDLYKLMDGKVSEFSLEYKSITSRNEEIWTKISISPLWKSQEEPLLYLAIIEDITAKVKAERALQQSIKLYESVVQSQKELICRFKKDTTLTFVNDAYAKVFGMSKEDLIGKKFLDFVPKQEHDRIMNILNEMAISGGNKMSQHRTIVSERKVIWQEWTDYPIYDADGNFVEFQSVGYDISERKEIEEKLSFERTLLRTIIDNAPVNIYVKDNNLKKVLANKAETEFLGASEEKEVLGLSDEEYHGSEVAQQTLIDDHLVLSGKSIFNQEFQLKKVSGEKCWYLVSKYPLYNEYNQIKGIVGLSIDITPIKEIEIELKHQTGLKDLLMRMASKYINIPLDEVDESINKSLGEIGEFVNADRAYIAEYDFEKQTGTFTFEWCADGVTPQIEELQAVPFEGLDLFLSKHVEGKVLNIPNVSRLEDQSVRDFLDSQDIKSLLCIPVMKNQECLGFVGFDSVQEYHYYTESEIAILQLFSEILVNLRLRSNEEKKLRTTDRFLSQTSQVAKVGGWEIYLSNNKPTWTAYTKEIVQLPQDIHPNLEDLSNLIRSDYDLKNLFQLVNKSILDGSEWVLETQIITYEDDLKWVRVKGSTEFDQGQPIRIFGTVQDISKQKENEQQLLLQSYILGQIAEGVLAADANGNILYHNKAITDFLGWDQDRLPTKSIFDLIASWNHPLSKDLIETIESRRDQWSKEMLIPAQYGRSFYAMIKYAPFYGDDGDFLGSILTISDVSKKKQAELLLKQSEQKFRSFIENAQDIIFTLSLDGRFLYISPNWESLTGYTVDKTINRSIYEIIEENDRHAFENFIQQIIHNHDVEHAISFKIRLDDGSFQWHLCSLSLLLEDDGQVKSLLGITRDITHIKAVELALLDSEQEANRMATKYKNIVETQSVFIVKTDISGKFLFANEYFYNYFDPDKMLKKGNSILNIFDQAKDIYQETVAKCVSEPNQPHEVILRNQKDGKPYGTKWEFKGITDDKGKVYEILCVGFDITEQLDSLDEAKHLIQVISDQNFRLKSFAHIVSHDIRSHSSNILSLIDFLNNVDDEEEQKEFFGMLTLSAEKLEQTIRDLNEILTINEQIAKPRKMKNLSRQVDKTAKILSGLLLREKVDFQNLVPPDIEVDVIPSYLDSILLNLLSNAVKYKSPDRTPVIRVKAHKKTNHIELEIEDNGIGIDLERYGDKIFGMYKTFHGNDDARGFGLYITRNQIEAMSGQIKVISQVGIGSTFKVYFSDADEPFLMDYLHDGS